MPHPSWALQFCSPNSCLHREARKPGENSDMDGIVQTLPTLGLCGFIFQPKLPLKAVIVMLRHIHEKKTVSHSLLVPDCILDSRKFCEFSQHVFERSVRFSTPTSLHP